MNIWVSEGSHLASPPTKRQPSTCIYLCRDLPHARSVCVCVCVRVCVRVYVDESKFMYEWHISVVKMYSFDATMELVLINMQHGHPPLMVNESVEGLQKESFTIRCLCLQNTARPLRMEAKAAIDRCNYEEICVPLPFCASYRLHLNTYSSLSMATNP